jgi:hypothetical protein
MQGRSTGILLVVYCQTREGDVSLTVSASYPDRH